jgi:cell division septation protein DedD
MFNDRMPKMRRQQLPQLVIAVTLIMLFLVRCGNAASTPVSEAPVATTTPEPPTATPTPEPPTPTEEPKPEESAATEESTTDGPRTGDVAPDFTLPDSNGNMVHLADELNDNRMVILVFCHAYN